MRHLSLTPYDGLLKPTRKIPVGSFIEDLEEVHKKTAFGTKVSILFSFIILLFKFLFVSLSPALCTVALHFEGVKP